MPDRLDIAERRCEGLGGCQQRTSCLRWLDRQRGIWFTDFWRRLRFVAHCPAFIADGAAEAASTEAASTREG